MHTDIHEQTEIHKEPHTHSHTHTQPQIHPQTHIHRDTNTHTDTHRDSHTQTSIGKQSRQKYETFYSKLGVLYFLRRQGVRKFQLKIKTQRSWNFHVKKFSGKFEGYLYHTFSLYIHIVSKFWRGSKGGYEDFSRIFWGERGCENKFLNSTKSFPSPPSPTPLKNGRPLNPFFWRRIGEVKVHNQVLKSNLQIGSSGYALW